MSSTILLFFKNIYFSYIFIDFYNRYVTLYLPFEKREDIKMDILYERIKQTRKERGMTQADLASAVGYTSKAMISQIEKGKINLQQSQIMKFAEALNVTAAFLMGYDLNGEKQFQLQFEYMTDLWNSLNKDGMNALLQYAELLTSNPKFTK